MKFIDNTGHIFEIKEYNINPIGYQYEISPYIFWIDSDYSTKLSINNWYVRPIRFLCASINDLNINLESDVFKLCNVNKLYDNCNINEYDFTNELKLTDVVITKNVITLNSQSTYNLITFYVFCKSENTGSVFTNIKIHIKDGESDIYCPITIGANFVDESEELIINAKNMGIELPKDILCAIYQNSSIDNFSDVNLYNIKLKEYLLNHMVIKGQCGNYNSAEVSLEWFGWGDNIILSRLLQTDNEFKEQFVNDYFKIETDIQDCFVRFKTTSLLSLSVLENKLTDNYHKQDFNSELVGEGNPIIEDLSNKLVTVQVGNIDYIKRYYDFSISDLSAKLACLQFMYKKYFLPVHLSIHSASIKHQVMNTPIKLMNVTNYNTTESPLSISDKRNKVFSSVEFTNESLFLLKNNNVFVDKNYNRFSEYNNIDKLKESEIEYIDIYNTLSAEIPIAIQTYVINNNGIKEEVFDKVVSCVLILSSNNEQIFESKFSFVTTETNKFISFNIIPYLLNNTKLDKDFWDNKIFKIDLLCNGTWYSKEFEIKLPELNIIFGNVKYKYDHSLCKQINSIDDSFIDFNINMYEPSLVSINDANFYNILHDIFKTPIEDNDKLLIQKYINSNDDSYNITDNLKYWNNICLYDITDLYNNPVYYNDLIEFTGDTKDKYALTSDTINIFRMFFDNNGTQSSQLVINNTTGYDFYLMRTKQTTSSRSKYFAIAISKDTLSSIIDENVKSELILNNKYKLKLVKKDKIFLIDRMFIDWKISNQNVFLDDDMIAAKVSNNFSPILINFDTRWKFKNISLGSNINKLFINKSLTSNTQSTIIPLYTTKKSHITGFYNVSVSYSIDNIFNHTETKISNLLIKKNETFS